MTDKKISNQEFLQKVKNAKVIPVLKFENTEDAMNTINALSAGGIQIAEITYRTENRNRRAENARVPNQVLRLSRFRALYQ